MRKIFHGLSLFAFLVLSKLLLSGVVGCGGGTVESVEPKLFTIGGTVSGLPVGTLVLQNNGANDRSVPANGTFTFPTAMADGATYAVTIKTQPSNGTCTVSGGNGTVAGANVTTVAVSCLRKIAFSSNQKTDGSGISNDNGTANIWVMNADGSDLKALTKATAAGAYSAWPQWSPDGTKIVFQSARKTDGSDAANDNGTKNVWVMNADGSGLKALTTSTVDGADIYAQGWSPDGTKISIVSNQKTDGSGAANDNGTSNIWVMNADGSGLTPLTTTTAAGSYNYGPTWSPDGTKIVFQSPRKTDGSNAASGNGTNNIWVVNADGSGGLEALTTATAADANSSGPQWSPDGTKIVFYSSQKTDGSGAANDNGTKNIWVVNADGSGGLEALTTATAADADSYDPAWSPDGTKIAFDSRRKTDGSNAANDNSTTNIWVVNADGNGGLEALTKATASGADSEYPLWSPDGTEIAFYSERKTDGSDAANDNGTRNIWVVNADGSGGLEALTTATVLDADSYDPDWAP